MAPVLGLLLNLDIGAYPLLVATMLVGTPAVSFIGAVGAALTLRAYRGGLLIALLVLPLYVPTLIFGMAAINGLLGASGTGSAFLILTALSLISRRALPVSCGCGPACADAVERQEAMDSRQREQKPRMPAFPFCRRPAAYCPLFICASAANP